MDNPEGSGVRAAARLRAWVAWVCGAVTALVGLAALLVLCFWPSVRVGWSLPEMEAAGVFLACVLPGLAVVFGIVAAIARRPFVGGLWVVLSFVVPVFFWAEWTYDETRIAYFLLTSLAAWSAVALGAICGRSSSRPILFGVVVLSVFYVVALACGLWGQLMVWGALLTLSHALVHAFGGVLLGASAVAAGRWLDGRCASPGESRLPAWARVMAGSVPVLALCAMAWRTMGMPQAAPPERYIPTPKTATLVYTTERWCVWLHQELVKRMRQHHLQRFVCRYYLQGDVDDEASLVYSEMTGHPLRVAAVLADGTMALQYGYGGCIVVTRDGTPLFSEPVELDPKPIREGAIQSSGVSPRPGASGQSSVQHTGAAAARTLALLGHELWRQSSLGDDVNDGETFIYGDMAWDRVRKKTLPATLKGRAIAVKNKVAYCITSSGPRGRDGAPERCSLDAIDLTVAEPASLYLLGLRRGALARHPRGYPLPPLRPFPHIIREDALIIWDGERWQRVRWLKRLDDE